MKVIYLFYRPNYILPNSYVKAQTVPQNVAVFRDRDFKKLTKLK